MVEERRPLRVYRTSREADEGFTLIELLIVIVVLGILAAVVIIALSGITGKSAVAACQADGATVATAIQTFENQNPTIGVVGVAGATVTLTQADLLAGGGETGDPYLGSWPSNSPHYQYAIASAAGGTGGGAYIAGQLTLAVPYTGTAELFAGPNSCIGVV
jgi:general secretion pathway protein G